jgi:hypothetical protein
MPRLLAVIPAALVALFAPGCGPAGASGSLSSGTGSGGIEHPMAGDAVVLRVSTGGGLVSVAMHLRTVPDFTLYGDGTVIVPGAIDLKYPGPAVFPLQSFHLSEDQVQSLLRRARAAGLLDPGRVDYGDMGSVAASDMPTTTVLLNAGGAHVRRDAYAVGSGAPGGGLTPAQARARQALARFVGRLPHAPSAATYRPARLSVYAVPFQGHRQFAGRPKVWPLASRLAAGAPQGRPYRCVAVAGADADTLLAQLASANEQTEWLPRPHAQRVYQLVVRPVLPDESPCSW